MSKTIERKERELDRQLLKLEELEKEATQAEFDGNDSAARRLWLSYDNVQQRIEKIELELEELEEEEDDDDSDDDE